MLLLLLVLEAEVIPSQAGTCLIREATRHCTQACWLSAVCWADTERRVRMRSRAVFEKYIVFVFIGCVSKEGFVSEWEGDV